MNPTPESKPGAKFSVFSLIISVLTSLAGALVILGGRGGGMEALSRLPPLILFGGGGLALAFFFGLIALARGERPLILTFLALAIPPVAGLLAPGLGR